MKGRSIFRLLSFESISLAVMAWRRWKIHPPTLWTSLFHSCTSRQRNHQSKLESKSNLCELPVWSFSHLKMPPSRTSWPPINVRSPQHPNGVTSVPAPHPLLSFYGTPLIAGTGGGDLSQYSANALMFIFLVETPGLQQIFQGQPFSSLIPAHF